MVALNLNNNKNKTKQIKWMHTTFPVSLLDTARNTLGQSIENIGGKGLVTVRSCIILHNKCLKTQDNCICFGSCVWRAAVYSVNLVVLEILPRVNGGSFTYSVLSSLTKVGLSCSPCGSSSQNNLNLTLQDTPRVICIIPLGVSQPHPANSQD